VLGWWRQGQVDLARDQIMRLLRSSADLPTQGDTGMIDPTSGSEPLDRRHAVPPGVRGDQTGVMAGQEFQPGELGPAKLWRMIAVPPDAGLVPPLELLLPSVQVGQAATKPFEVARCGAAFPDRRCGIKEVRSFG
jgi:hypothetical protein